MFFIHIIFGSVESQDVKLFHFMVEGTEAQRSSVTLIRSHRLVREPGVGISQMTDIKEH